MISTLALRLAADFGFTPVSAAEIEFYLHGDQVAVPAFETSVKKAAEAQGLSLFAIEKERGAGQHEVSITPASPEETVSDIEALKTIIADAAAAQDLRADFSAKPFADQPGSGLHIHIHLEDADGTNAFYKDDERMSDALRFSLGGLMHCLPLDMPIFAPSSASYARFAPGSNAPLTVSWGANNRTVALRLPDSLPAHKRIEHRVAGADADPHHVMTAILAAIHYGLQKKCDPGPQIYGDASLEQYGLPRLSA